MAVDLFSVKGYRSIVDTGDIPLGPITLFVGKNNSGKTALLKALYLLQEGSQYGLEDFHLRSSAPIQVSLRFDGSNTPEFLNPHLLEDGEPMTVNMQLLPGGTPSLEAVNSSLTNKRVFEHLTAARPSHLFVPIFGERRTAAYNEDVSGKNGLTITIEDHALTARLDGVANPAHSVGKNFHRLMERVFGMSISTFATNQGKTPGFVISLEEGISLRRMGDGLTSMVGLLSELARDEHHIYLIEEPENGIHPEALSSLLEVISESAENNQFLITTHSEHVVRHLGAISSTLVHKVRCEDEDGIPTTTVESSLDRLQRRQLLSDMGYFFPNPVAWVVLEESSAQSIIEEILVPLFLPELKGATIIASGGASKVKPTLDDLDRTILCLHLGSSRQETWVFVDSDDSGREAVKALTDGYRDWPPERFQVFPAEMFEEFYPRRFEGSIKEIKEAPKSQRKDLKRNLLIEVLSWAKDHPDEAKLEFAESASPVLEMLGQVHSLIR